jgi:type IV pilus assembly protein PilE
MSQWRDEARASRGFTLIELLVALAILAIVSAVAIPIYTQYSIRTYRTEAQGDLLDCAQSMERAASRAFTYASALDTDADGTGDTTTGAVTANICTPKTTRYNVTVQAADANTFTIRATPIAGSAVASNGLLEITANGTQRWDKNNDGDTADAGENVWHE